MARQRTPKQWTEIDQRLWHYRIELGMTWRQVAAKMAKSPAWCQQRWAVRMAELADDQVDVHRSEELQRLELRDQRLTQMWLTAMTPARDADGHATAPDYGAALAAIRVMNDVAKLRIGLLGLQKPAQVEVHHSAAETASTIERELEAFIAGAGAGASLPPAS